LIEATGIPTIPVFCCRASLAAVRCVFGSRDSVDIPMRSHPETREKGCRPQRSEQPFDTITIARQIISFYQSNAVKRYYK